MGTELSRRTHPCRIRQKNSRKKTGVLAEPGRSNPQCFWNSKRPWINTRTTRRANSEPRETPAVNPTSCSGVCCCVRDGNNVGELLTSNGYQHKTIALYTTEHRPTDGKDFVTLAPSDERTLFRYRHELHGIKTDTLVSHSEHSCQALTIREDGPRVRLPRGGLSPPVPRASVDGLFNLPEEKSVNSVDESRSNVTGHVQNTGTWQRIRRFYGKGNVTHQKSHKTNYSHGKSNLHFGTGKVVNCKSRPERNG